MDPTLATFQSWEEVSVLGMALLPAVQGVQAVISDWGTHSFRGPCGVCRGLAEARHMKQEAPPPRPPLLNKLKRTHQAHQRRSRRGVGADRQTLRLD